MVQEETTEYLAESKSWRDDLAARREKLIQYQKDLLGIASKKLSGSDLQELEHFQNNFYIQLINIHDVKKDLRQYESAINGNLENLQQKHDSFRDEYDNLVHILDGLDAEFEAYKQKPH